MIKRVKGYCARCRELFHEYQTLVSVKKLVHYEDTVLLVGTPLHGNLGDQAIALAEIDFFAQNGYRVVEIPSPMVKGYLCKWKKLICGKRIYVHGGGFVGSLWPEEQEMLEIVIDSFPENEIVILPQTVYFDKVDSRVVHLNELIGKHGNVVLCTREKYSYGFAHQYLYNAKVILVPDMVLSANWFDNCIRTRDKVLFCMRRDLEKKVSEDTIDKLQNIVSRYYPTADVVFTDTVVDDTIYPHMRKKRIQEKLAEMATSQLVITDRLHGMVLSAMTNTPTLVFSNCNYKVRGIYDWIANNSYLVYCDDTTRMEELIAELVNQGCSSYCFDDAKSAFGPLLEIVGNYHG